MEQIFTFATPLLSILGLVGLVVAGGLAFFNTFNKASKDSQKEAQNDTDRLISLLKDQVGVLERKVNDQEEQLKGLKTRLDTLISENHTLRDVLQGRDQVTKAYQEEARRTFEVADTVMTMVKRIDENVLQMMNQEKVVETTTKKVKRI